MTHQPDFPNLAIEYYGGIGFDPRLIDAIIVDASANAPTGTLSIDRNSATKALFEAAIGQKQANPGWVAEAARIVWANRNEILNAEDSRA